MIGKFTLSLVWKGYSPLLTCKTRSKVIKLEPRLLKIKMKKLILNQGLSSSAFEVKPWDISKENLLYISFKIILNVPWLVTFIHEIIFFSAFIKHDNKYKDFLYENKNINKQKLFMNKIFNVQSFLFLRLYWILKENHIKTCFRT